MAGAELEGVLLSGGVAAGRATARPSRDAARVAEEPAVWPGRVRELAERSRLAVEGPSRESLLAELWSLLGLALHKYVRLQTARLGRLSADDMADITADKALDLIRRLEAGRWDPAAGSDAQLCAFLASVARHGVIDLLRRRRREALAGTGLDRVLPETPVDERPLFELEWSVDARRYARAIVECAARLTARARLAWLLRVFGGLRAAQIAKHPGILSSTGGVDVMLSRSRRWLRECLASKRIEPLHLPPGTFVELWSLIDADRRHRERGR